MSAIARSSCALFGIGERRSRAAVCSACGRRVERREGAPAGRRVMAEVQVAGVVAEPLALLISPRSLKPRSRRLR